MTQWPNDTRADLDRFYGPIQLDDSGLPTAAWQNANLTTIDPPWKMVASWDPDLELRRLRCHKKVAASLSKVLDAIWAHYGKDQAKIEAARMHLCGGVYNFRRARGLARLSTHSWGVAIDLDPANNPLGRKWKKNAGMMPEPVIAAFKAEGWTWGGDWSRGDAMHFQAADT
jgi:hypothetical protein